MRKIAAALIGAAVAATMISGAGLAVASTTPASAHPAVTKTERFQIVTGLITSNRASVIATGSVFTAAGVDIMGDSVDTFKFPGGTLKVRHSNGTGTPHFDPRSCLLQATIRGAYTIGHGTGAYAGISGHGTYVLRILGIARRNLNGTCSTSHKVAPVASQMIVDAHGPLHL